MDIYETIKTRRSVRSYRDKPVDDPTLVKILEAARLAPSAHNSQEYKLVVVTDPEQKKAVSRACSGLKFINEAPVVIAAVALNPEYALESGFPVCAMDAAIALDHITLAAVQEEL